MDRAHDYTSPTGLYLNNDPTDGSDDTSLPDIDSFDFFKRFTNGTRFIAAFHSDLEYASGDINLSAVTFDTDGTEVVVDTIPVDTNLADFHTLYIPNTNSGAGVILCPGATSLAEQFYGCDDMESFTSAEITAGTGKTVGNSAADGVFVSLINSTDTGAGTDLYKVEGLKDSGGGPLETYELELNAVAAYLATDTDLDSNFKTGGADDTFPANNIGAYQWNDGSSNLMALNMPFNYEDGVTVTNQRDFSGESNNGTRSGATFQTKSGGSCKVGGCMSFNGSGDYIDITDAPSLRPSSSLTLEAWVYADTISGTDMILSKVHGTNWISYYIALSDGQPKACVMNKTLGQWPCWTADASITDSQWTHLVFTWEAGAYDSSDGVLYVNGSVGGCMSFNGSYATGFTIENDAEPVELGQSSTNATPANFFDGLLDEVQIYPYALHEDQISLLYTDQNAGLGGPTVIDSSGTNLGDEWDLDVTLVSDVGVIGDLVSSGNTVSITGELEAFDITLSDPTTEAIDLTSTDPGISGTVGYQWVVAGSNLMALNMPFNDDSTQEDLSGNNYDGTISGATFNVPASCQVGGCLHFGGDGDLVALGDVLDSYTTGEDKQFTISLWTKPGSASMTNNYFVIKSGNSSCGENNSQYIFRLLDDSKSSFTYYGDLPATTYRGILGSTQITNTSKWYHIVMSYDGTVDTGDGLDRVKIYVDGVSETTSIVQTAGTFSSSFAMQDGTSHLGIGMKLNSSGTECGSVGRYDGYIDEAQIYPRVLTASQVTQLYTDGNNNVGGPTDISYFEHASGELWELDAFEIDSSGNAGPELDMDSVTISAAAATTLDITDPTGTNEGAFAITYKCNNDDSEARDIKVYWSDDGSDPSNAATLTAVSSGTIDGNEIDQITCDDSNQTFTWDSEADGVGIGAIDNDVKLKIEVVNVPSISVSHTSEEFTVLNSIDLCVADIGTYPELDDDDTSTYRDLMATESSLDGLAISIIDCTVEINGTHSFSSVIVGDASGVDDSILVHSETTSGTDYTMDITTTGDFEIKSDGIIDLDERGSIGGIGGTAAEGTGAGESASNNSESGGGAGYGGSGGDGFGSTGGITYGSMIAPTDLGSGGGGTRTVDQAGGDGGGAVKLVVGGTMTLNGLITADGGMGIRNGGSFSDYASGGGSGGSVWLDVDTLEGSGSITANGGTGQDEDDGDSGEGGGGRIAIYYDTDNSSVTTAAHTSNQTIPFPSSEHGGAGTIYTKDNAANGNIIIDNNGSAPAVASTLLPATPLTYGDITIDNAAQVGVIVASELTADTLTLDNGAVFAGEELSITTVTISNGASLTHRETDDSNTYSLDLTSTTVTIDGTSSIDVDAKGHIGGIGVTAAGGTGAGENASGNSECGAGGAYGGDGGDGFGSTGGSAYGSLTQPADNGSGGGGTTSDNKQGGDGGGAVKLSVGGTMTLNGDITAGGGMGIRNGGSFQDYASGAGSGGSVWLDVDTLEGSGSITANGGTGQEEDDGDSGAGGGGRIAIYYDTNNSSVTTAAHTSDQTVSSPSSEHGGAGTIYIKDNAASYGDLTLDNNSLGSNVTPLFITGESTSYAFEDFSVINNGTLVLDSPGVCTSSAPALLLHGTVSTSGGGAVTDNLTMSADTVNGTGCMDRVHQFTPANIPLGLYLNDTPTASTHSQPDIDSFSFYKRFTNSTNFIMALHTDLEYTSNDINLSTVDFDTDGTEVVIIVLLV